MSASHALLVWFHVLLFAMWLGADVGVFVAAAMSRRKGIAIEERVLLLKLAASVDLSPRIAMALMLPVGVTLATAWGVEVAPMVLPALWVVSSVWIGSIIVAHRWSATELGRRVLLNQRVAFVAGALAMLGWSASLLGPGGVPDWLALKIGLFGVIFLAAVGIDLAFGPVLAALAAPDISRAGAADRAYATAMNRCLVTVLLLYVLLLCSSLLGVLKP